MPNQTASYEAMATGSPGRLARTYFRVKPLIPRSIRLALRRKKARGIVDKCRQFWPINENAGALPPGWRGWPGDKEFAVVFTHDVESGGGLRNVEKLASLEASFGLCSSFNFIPEGTYDDPRAIRGWLGERGFEVGVHDLNHDGRLYGSRRGFCEKAKRINHYLRDWRAVGFRSAFMLRQLEWLHDLDVLYDSSTFDTDPFEPQPEGSNTIFPFEVKPAGGGHSGYIELPYTLPQDSTLFLLLGETTIDIWKRKLDWVAARGGLALINIHPDYVDFAGRWSSSSYPSSLVKDFLDYLCRRYSGSFWNPLARDLAEWFRTEAYRGIGPPDPSC